MLLLKENMKEITMFLPSFLLTENSLILCCFCCCWVGMKYKTTWAFWFLSCVLFENFKEFGALLHQRKTSWSTYELFWQFQWCLLLLPRQVACVFYGGKFQIFCSRCHLIVSTKHFFLVFILNWLNLKKNVDVLLHWFMFVL